MKDLVKSSKLLSLVLRHKPAMIGLDLDENGWANTGQLLQKLNTHGFHFDLELLKLVVEKNDKQRFSFSEDLSKIRANQGHSIEVDLDLAPKAPPSILYHGTARKNLDSIKKQGLLKAKRHHVHLSADTEMAKNVGARHGEPIVLKVHAGEMNLAGIQFFQSENGVWLTEHVAPKYLTEMA